MPTVKLIAKLLLVVTTVISIPSMSDEPDTTFTLPDLLVLRWFLTGPEPSPTMSLSPPQNRTSVLSNPSYPVIRDSTIMLIRPILDGTTILTGRRLTELIEWTLLRNDASLSDENFVTVIDSMAKAELTGPNEFTVNPYYQGILYNYGQLRIWFPKLREIHASQQFDLPPGLHQAELRLLNLMSLSRIELKIRSSLTKQMSDNLHTAAFSLLYEIGRTQLSPSDQNKLVSSYADFFTTAMPELFKGVMALSDSEISELRSRQIESGNVSSRWSLFWSFIMRRQASVSANIFRPDVRMTCHQLLSESRTR